MTKIDIARTVIQALGGMFAYYIGSFMWEPSVGAAMCITFWIGALTMIFKE